MPSSRCCPEPMGSGRRLASPVKPAWQSSDLRSREKGHVVKRVIAAVTALVGLFDALLATCSDHTSGLLSVLYAGDQPIAAQFGLRAGELVVGWFTAYDLRFRKYSPGLINVKQMAQGMAAAGIHTIDMGAGAANYYKETLKSHDSFVAKGVVTSRSILGATHRARIASTMQQKTPRWPQRASRARPSGRRGRSSAEDRRRR